MRKSIKKIAATLLAATMVLGTMATGFADEAATEEEVVTGPVYTLVGSPELGLDWDPAAENLVMTQVSNSVYKFDTTATAAADAEFKVIKDGADNAWAYQMQYGTGVFTDNASQFKLTVAAGDVVSVYANVVTGEVVVLQNGVNAYEDLLVKWDTKSEFEGDFDTLANVMTTYVVAEDATPYSVVGAGELVGVVWDAASAFGYAVEKTGVFTKTLVATAAGDLEFKILEDGVNNAWTQQFQYGVATRGDNKSQFKVTAEAGDVFEVTFVPATGDVTIVKNGAIDATAQVMWDSTPEWAAESEANTWATLADAKVNFVYADAEVTYSVVGTSDLVGLDWAADNGAYIVAGTDGVYKKVVMATKDSDALEFKIVQDGVDNAWAYQLQLGVAEFGDNKSQFRVAAVAGDVFEITITPATGDVTVTKNGEAYEYLVRWATKDEDPQDFLTKAEALALYVPSSKEPTTAAPTDATTAAPADATTAAPTTAANQSTKTGDVAPVALMVVLVAAVAVVSVVAKKKEA